MTQGKGNSYDYHKLITGGLKKNAGQASQLRTTGGGPDPGRILVDKKGKAKR